MIAPVSATYVNTIKKRGYAESVVDPGSVCTREKNVLVENARVLLYVSTKELSFSVRIVRGNTFVSTRSGSMSVDTAGGLPCAHTGGASHAAESVEDHLSANTINENVIARTAGESLFVFMVEGSIDVRTVSAYQLLHATSEFSSDV